MKPDKLEPRERQHPGLPGAFPMPLNGAMTEVLERSAAAFGKNMRTFQHESARFVTRRAEESANAMERFTKCRTLPDIFAAQQQWVSDIARAYNEEWARFGEFMGEMAQGSGAQKKASAEGPTEPHVTRA
jgi:hypothetical protein